MLFFDEDPQDEIMEDAAEAEAPVDDASEMDRASDDDAPEMETAPDMEAAPVDEMDGSDDMDTAADSMEMAEPEVEADEQPEPAPEPAMEMAADTEDYDDESDRNWYVVHCYSGYENKVRHNLEQRIESMGMKDMIFDVVVPTEEEIEVREGKRRTVERRVFPGYILVNMVMTEESWYVVRNTPGVTSFVGMGNDPVPLRPEEVKSIIKRMEADAPRIKVSFRQGERVRIVDGPFNDFRGTVDEIDMERAKVRVMVNFFGRETPVELDFLQVEKS